jgi:UPF0271 protein
MARIDLNCDLGEGVGSEAALMPLITSANIACGAHAGDEATMRTSVALALRHGVAIGAHPGFEDRENFGRRELSLPPEQIRSLVLRQTRALQEIAQAQGAAVTHVKPHGALYNLAARDAAVARAIAEGVRACGPSLVLFGLAGSPGLEVARAAGLRVVHEVFADRTYQRNGALTPRSRADALISDESAAVAQVLRVVQIGCVRSTDGADVALPAETVCLHGDGSHAVAFAGRLRRELESAGVAVEAYRA